LDVFKLKGVHFVYIVVYHPAFEQNSKIGFMYGQPLQLAWASEEFSPGSNNGFSRGSKNFFSMGPKVVKFYFSLWKQRKQPFC